MNVKPTDIYGSQIAFSSENIYVPELSMSLSEVIRLRKVDIPVAWEECIKDVRDNVYNMMTLKDAVVTLETDSGVTAHAESFLSGGTLYIILYNIDGTISSIGGNANTIIYNDGETTVSGGTVADRLTYLTNHMEYLEEKLKELTSGTTFDTFVTTDEYDNNIAVIGDAAVFYPASAVGTSLGRVEDDVLIF